MIKKVTKTIYQTNEATARRVLGSDEYKKLGIRGVICPAFNVRIDTPPDLPALILPIDDYDSISPMWLRIAADFRYLFQPVLVHCRGGKNRSVAVCAALAWHEAVQPHEVYERLGHKPTPELQASVWRYFEEGARLRDYGLGGGDD